jgi:hypothetical protein
MTGARSTRLRQQVVSSRKPCLEHTQRKASSVDLIAFKVIEAKCGESDYILRLHFRKSDPSSAVNTAFGRTGSQLPTELNRQNNFRFACELARIGTSPSRSWALSPVSTGILSLCSARAEIGI